MYIDRFEKDVEKKEGKVENFFSRNMEMEKEYDSAQEEIDSRKIDEQVERKIISKYAQEALCHWQAPEFEIYELSKKWVLYLGTILIAVIAYAVYANSPIMAITFILIGLVGYMYMEKEPRMLDFMVTEEGIIAGKEIFEYDRIKSFWIFYEEDGSRVISLHMRSIITPYMHIPIGENDPVEIREALLENMEEIKQEHNIVETLERLFRI